VGDGWWAAGLGSPAGPWLSAATITGAGARSSGPGGAGLLVASTPANPTRTGTAIASFDATTSGDYPINANRTADTGIAIGGDILWDAAPHVAGTIAVFLVGVGAGLTLIIVTAVPRSSARQVAGAPR
jgi:hypothetical protein